MDKGVKVGLSLEWRPAWLMGLKKPTGAVFLYCTHCNSENLVEADFCSFLVSEEKSNYRPKCIVQNTYSSPQHGTQPDDYGSQVSQPRTNYEGRWEARWRRRSSPKEGKERNRKTWCCQLLFESQFSHLCNGKNAYFIVAKNFFSSTFHKHIRKFH